MRLGPHNDRLVEVILSERNLRALLSKVQRPDSQRTLIKSEAENGTLIVKAEPDDEHYAGRKPGIVHPRDLPPVVDS